MAKDKTMEVEKIDANTFDVTETITRTIDKKELKAQIDELELHIGRLRQQSGIEGLEKDLEEKKALLSQLK